MGYVRDRKCDFNALHFEWSQQPDLAHSYGVELAEARKAVDIAEKAMDVEKAKAYKRAVEVVKSPVDAVKAEAALDEKYLKRLDDYNTAKYQLGLVQAAYESIGNQKKRALENLVTLYGQQYYAAPIEPRDYENWKQRRFSEESAEKVQTRATEASKTAVARRRERTV